MIWYGPRAFINFFSPSLFPPHYFKSLLQHTTTHSIAFRNTLWMSLDKCHAILPQIASELTVNTHLVQSPYRSNSSKPQIVIQAHLTYFCTMLISHTTLPGFPHPTFRQWHWSPDDVDINNSLIHGSQFRKEVVSYWFIVSKSLVIIPNFSISLHQCILFYYVSLILK